MKPSAIGCCMRMWLDVVKAWMKLETITYMWQCRKLLPGSLTSGALREQDVLQLAGQSTAEISRSGFSWSCPVRWPKQGGYITLFRIQFKGNCPGMQIKLHGFTLQANLNGCRGRLIRWCGKKNERWEMLLLSHAETTRIHFKSPSMKVVPMDATHCQRRNCHIHPSIHPSIPTYIQTYIHTHMHIYTYRLRNTNC